MKKLLNIALVTLVAFSSSAWARPKEKKLEIDDQRHVGYYFNDKKSKIICVLLPGGGQSKEFAQGLLPHAKNFEKMGFSTAVVYTNFGPLLNQTNTTQYLVKLLENLKKEHNAEGFIMLGLSNGGTGSIQAAESNQNLIIGVIAVPSSAQPQELAKGLPVYFRLGENDQLGWAKSFDKIKSALESSGAEVDAEIVKNGAHIFDLNWKEIEAWLGKHNLTPEGEKEAEQDHKKEGAEPLTEFRQWQNTEGKAIHAQLLSVSNGTAKLKTRNGKIYDYPLEQLSKNDQEEITRLQKKHRSSNEHDE